MKKKPLFGFQWSCNRRGELEFLTSTQAYTTTSKKKLLKEIEGLRHYHMNECRWPPLTEKEFSMEYGKPIIYRLTEEE